MVLSYVNCQVNSCHRRTSLDLFVVISNGLRFELGATRLEWLMALTLSNHVAPFNSLPVANEGKKSKLVLKRKTFPCEDIFYSRNIVHISSSSVINITVCAKI